MIAKPAAAALRGRGRAKEAIATGVGATKVPIARGLRSAQRVGQATAGTAVTNRQ